VAFSVLLTSFLTSALVGLSSVTVSYWCSKYVRRVLTSYCSIVTKYVMWDKALLSPLGTAFIFRINFLSLFIIMNSIKTDFILNL
jgi:hypothetical protein